MGRFFRNYGKIIIDMGTSISLVLRLVFVDIIGDIFYFPVWWYSRGLIRAFRRMLERIGGHEASLGVGIWIRSLFVPMFGQYDAAGRIISFIMRSVQIVVRGILLIVLTAAEIIFFLLWIFAPLFVLQEIIYQIRFFLY